MRFIATVAIALVCSTAFARNPVLQAIADVETSDNPMAVGHQGELSVYQIKREVWVHYSAMPFKASRRGWKDFQDEADRVALAHLAHVTKELQAAHIQVTAYALALCWNAGITAVVEHRYSTRNGDYATRVNNLYVAYYAPKPCLYANYP
jgi:hypothetical protein